MRISYQRAISDKLFKIGVFPLVDLLLQDTKCHRFFDDIVVVRDVSFVNTAMEKSRRIVVADTPLAWVCSGLDEYTHSSSLNS